MSNSTPMTKWPQISDILTNHDGGRPDPTRELAGQAITIWLEDGDVLELRFTSDVQLDWTQTGHTSQPAQTYQAFVVRPGCYFVDFVDQSDRSRSVSLWLDTGNGRALLIEGSVHERQLQSIDLLKRVEMTGRQSVPKLTFRSGATSRKDVLPYAPSTALQGRYMRYVYSDTHVYDHFYVSDKYYFWYCWQGPDAGIGEFDEAQYYELAPEVFLVCWTEKFLPCLAVTIEDYGAMTSIGKVFGADSHSWETGNNTVGARMTRLADIPSVSPDRGISRLARQD